MREAIREAGILFLIATLLGLAYTAVTGKGLFADRTFPASPTGNSLPRTVAPSMIHLQEAQRLFETGSALFLDSRNAYDYDRGHIKGAMNIPLKEWENAKHRLESLSKDHPFVVYCDGAECNSSIELAAKLYAAGFTNVKIFFGGWREWEGSGLPTNKSD
jgi:rhodanese-related sulfurtransferase